MSKRPALLLAAAAMAACAGAAVPIATTPGPAGTRTGHATVVPGRLWLERADGSTTSIGVVDVSSGRDIFSMPAGALSREGSRLFALVAAGRLDVLEEIDPHTGAVRQSQPVPGGFRLPTLGPAERRVGLSPDGRHLALVRTDVTADQVTGTHLLVYGTDALAHPPAAVNLSGNFGYDGLSNDGHNLYLIENPEGPTAGGGYHIRRYDLTGSGLDPGVVADKRTGEESMAGTPIDQVTTGGGAWQFTLYAFGMGAPFVHALNLDAGIAYCVDLPKAPRDQALDLLWGLVASHDGAHVYAVNAANGAAIEMDASSPWQTREQSLAPLPATPPAVAMPWQAVSTEAKRVVHGATVISADDRTIYALAEQGIAIIDTARLQVRGTLAAGLPLASLSISPDGRRLYAMRADSDASLLQIDAAGGDWARLSVSGHPVGVLRALP